VVVVVDFLAVAVRPVEMWLKSENDDAAAADDAAIPVGNGVASVMNPMLRKKRRKRRKRRKRKKKRKLLQPIVVIAFEVVVHISILARRTQVLFVGTDNGPVGHRCA
jgi:hypothetical protein